MKRTTIVFKADDLENLEAMRLHLGGLSETEAVRRSLRITRELLDFAKNGGSVVFEKDGKRETVRFL